MNLELRKSCIMVPFALLVSGLLIWSGYTLFELIKSDSISSDFISYWSSGRLLLNGDNPYSPERIMALQQSVGPTRKGPIVMYSPPWVLPFVLPFCIGNYFFSKYLWFLVMVGLVFICPYWLWSLYGGSKKRRYCSLIILSTFFPIYLMLYLGQIVPIILVGLVGFLYFEEKRQLWPAALFSAFLTLKPQTLYLFWIALFFWIIEKRNWSFAVRTLVVNFSIMLIPLIFNTQVYDQYLNAVAGQSFAYKWATPTIGTYLRLIFGEEKHWLQFLPMATGMLWLLFYWVNRRKHWEWKQALPLILFISLITTFYCWSWDYALILIALIQSLAWMTNREAISANFKITAILLYLFVNIFAIIENHIFIGGHHYIWLPPTLFFFYYSTWKAASFRHSSEKI